MSALLGKDLVARSQASEDRRRCVITPTERGRELMHLTRARRRSSVGDLLDDWTPDEVRAFAGLLDRYNAAVARRYLRT